MLHSRCSFLTKMENHFGWNFLIQKFALDTSTDTKNTTLYTQSRITGALKYTLKELVSFNKWILNPRIAT